MPAIKGKRRKQSPVKRKSPRKTAIYRPIETKEKNPEIPKETTPATATTLNQDVSPK